MPNSQNVHTVASPEPSGADLQVCVPADLPNEPNSPVDETNPIPPEASPPPGIPNEPNPIFGQSYRSLR